MSVEPIVIGDDGIVPDFHVTRLKRLREREDVEIDLYNDNENDHESKRARLNSEPLKSPFTDVTATGARSSYTLHVMDIGSHYLLCGLNTKGSYAPSTGGPFIFPKSQLFTATDVEPLPPPAEILERFVPVWREHNSREPGALCVFDHFAWLLFLAEERGGVLPQTLDLDKHHDVIEAYVANARI